MSHFCFTVLRRCYGVLWRLRGFAFLLLLAFKPVWVMATTSNLCYFMPGYNTINATLPISGSVAVPRNAAIGSRIAIFQYNFPYASGESVVYCPAAETTGVGSWTLRGNVPSFVSGSTTVYKTPLAGVGVKIYRLGKTLPYSINLLPNTYYMFVDPVYIEFVVTGPMVSSGVITAATDLPSMSYWFDTNLNIVNIQPVGQLSISTATCNTGSVTVDLGTRKLQDFPGINQPMTPAAVPFNIAVNNCPAGISSITYMLTPTTTALGNGVVSLGAGIAPVAAGVGIQLLDGGGVPVTYNVATPVQGVTTAGGSYTIPLKATYFQTAANIKGGNANTSFTFTMNYQ